MWRRSLRLAGSTRGLLPTRLLTRHARPVLHTPRQVHSSAEPQEAENRAWELGFTCTTRTQQEHIHTATWIVTTDNYLKSQHHLPRDSQDVDFLLTRSWKIILSITIILTFLLVGLQNQQWLKETEFPQMSKQAYAIFAEYGSRLNNYQARLRMPKEQLELLKKESQTLEKNFREILHLIEQINVLKALLRDMRDGVHDSSWPAHRDAAQNQASTEMLDEEMSQLVHYVLKKLRGDHVQMADYALKSAGASVIEAGTSESYKNNKAKLYWHGIGFLNYEMPPDIILQPDVYPGKCWAFPGSQGHILIKLARKIIPTAVTIEHISEKDADLSDFRLCSLLDEGEFGRQGMTGNTLITLPCWHGFWGVMKKCEGEEMLLGQFLYNKTEATIQTFELQHEDTESLLCIKLKILSNWGHAKYTCLYRFRVHGVPSDHT